MKENLNIKVNKDDTLLKIYGTMGAAFLAAAPQTVDAQIIHHDPPDVTLTTTGGAGAGLQTAFLFVDVDGGTAAAATTSAPGDDIGIYHYVYPPLTTSVWGTARNVAFGAGTGSINGVARSVSSYSASFFNAQNKAIGATVCAASGTASTYGAGVLYNHQYYPLFYGTFASTGAFSPAGTPVTGYLGIQFEIAGATHYGWARVTSLVSGDPRTTDVIAETTIHEWAYNSVPDACIAVGALPPPVADPIPTMGEWGLICLNLLLMIVGFQAIRQKNGTLAINKKND